MYSKFANVVGYGIMQRGACDRDGSLSSYDYSFSTYSEALKYEENIIESGYGNTISGINPVTVYDEVVADLNNNFKINNYEDNPLTLKDFHKILSSYDINIPENEITSLNLIEGVVFSFELEENKIIDFNMEWKDEQQIFSTKRAYYSIVQDLEEIIKKEEYQNKLDVKNEIIKNKIEEVIDILSPNDEISEKNKNIYFDKLSEMVESYFKDNLKEQDKVTEKEGRAIRERATRGRGGNER